MRTTSQGKECTGGGSCAPPTPSPPSRAATPTFIPGPPRTPNLSTSPRCAPIHPKWPRARSSGVRAGAGGEEQRGGSGAGKGGPKSCLTEAPRARSAGALKAGCALLFWRSHSSTGDKTWPWGWDEALRGFIAAGTEPPAPGAAQILRGGGTRAPRCGVGGARPGLGAKRGGTERKAGWGARSPTPPAPTPLRPHHRELPVAVPPRPPEPRSVSETCRELPAGPQPPSAQQAARAGAQPRTASAGTARGGEISAGN